MEEMIRIPFNRRTKALGRNGTMHMIGLRISRISPRSVILEPTNTRKVAGRSYLIIPDEHIDEVIKALIDYKEGAWI